MSSFSIHSPTSSTATAPLDRVQTIRPVVEDGHPQVEAAAAPDEDSVSVDTMPGAPPPEVMAAIAGASDAYDELAAAGRHVSFGSDPDSGAFTIQLQDTDGTVLSGLRASQVLDLADGNATDPTRKSADVHERQFGH